MSTFCYFYITTQKPMLQVLISIALLPYKIGFNGETSNLHQMCTFYHYENTPMQYTCTCTVIFHSCKKFCKNDNFQMKNSDIFISFAHNIECGYTFEPPH